MAGFLMRGSKNWLLLLVTNAVIGAPEVVDYIAATVGLGADKHVVVASELEKPVFFAQFKPSPLEGHIDHKIQLIEARNVKIGEFTFEPSQAEVNAALERLKISLGCKADELAFETQLLDLGLTLGEVKEQIASYIMVSRMWGFTFPDKAVVPLSAIEDYHHHHPEMVPAKAHLMVAELEASRLKALLDRHSGPDRDTKLAKELDFFDLDTLAISELEAKSREMVLAASPGQLCVPELEQAQLDEKAKVQVIKVVDKSPARKKTLEERKGDIIRTIELQEYEKRYAGYLKELQEKVLIRTFKH